MRKLWMMVFVMVIVVLGAAVYFGANAAPPQSVVEQPLDRKQLGL